MTFEFYNSSIKRRTAMKGAVEYDGRTYEIAQLADRIVRIEDGKIVE